MARAAGIAQRLAPPADAGSMWQCEVEGCGIEFKQSGRRRHVDHIVPARFIQRLKLGNPHLRENLQCICGACHGYKLKADQKCVWATNSVTSRFFVVTALTWCVSDEHSRYGRSRGNPIASCLIRPVRVYPACTSPDRDSCWNEIKTCDRCRDSVAVFGFTTT